MSATKHITSLCSHFPKDVLTILDESKFKVYDRNQGSSLIGSGKIAVYDRQKAVGTPGEGSSVAVYSKSITTTQDNFFEFSFKDRICTDTRYKAYTFNQKPLEPDAVNAIYVACMQACIENRKNPYDKLPLARAILDLTTNKVLQTSDLNMMFVATRYWGPK